MESYSENIIAHYSYDLKIKFEPFFLEYNPREEVVKLPGLFNHSHSGHILPKVILCDPAGNIFQVGVEVICAEAYFVEGWKEVGKFYGHLHNGGWAKLIFVAADMFLVSFKDLLERPVSYPIPAKICLLHQQPRALEYPRVDLVPNHYASIYKKPDLFHTLEFKLTSLDVTSGFLHIPLEFCQIAFRDSGRRKLLFDEYGLEASCVVDFHRDHPELTGITEGWLNFCSAKRYFEGLRVELAVPVSNPHLISIMVMDI